MRSINILKSFSREGLELVEEAANYAQERNHNICSIFHLTAILASHRLFEELAKSIGLNLNDFKNQLSLKLKNINYPVHLSKGKIYLTPDFKKCLLSGYEFETQIPNGSVGPEDLILATLSSSEIKPILEASNVPSSKIENFINTLKGGPKGVQDENINVLKKYTIDITKLAQEGSLEEIIDRESEYSQLTRILTRRSKNNAVLIGENGVGRTSIIYKLAKKIVNGQVGPELKTFHIAELNISAIVTAITSRNMSDLITLLQEEIYTLGNTLLIIRNFSLNSTYSIEESIAVNLLKNLVKNKQIRIVLTTTSSNFKVLSTKDTFFNQSFDTIKVSEPSIQTAIEIVKSKIQYFETHHSLTIPNDLIEDIVNLSARYLQERFLPVKAIDLLDESCSKARQENKSSLELADVQTVISEKTGIPIQKLGRSEARKLMDLEELLSQKVIGQKSAIHSVSEVVRRSRAGLKDPNKPIGSFLFLGPSGVGKTYLAQNLTEIVYDNPNAMVRLDMSEFSESHTVQRLIGSPPGYVGYEEGGQLTNPIWERPYSLILLDEIEKANPKVFDIFLQVLDEGRLTDGQGRTVDFKNTIIIATSNIASEDILAQNKKLEEIDNKVDKDQFYDDHIFPILKEYFRPEFINRFDDIVIFEPLSPEELTQIAKLQVTKIQKKLKDKNIQIKISDEKLHDFAKRSYKPSFGARPLIRLIQDEIETLVAQKIIRGEIQEGDTITI